MKLKLWLLSVIMIVGGLLAGTASSTAQEKSYSADRFDVDITIEEGGALLVTESVTYDFVGGPFTFVFRELPTDHTDGLTIVDASVNGRSYPQGTGAGQVEIEGNDPIRVTWHMEPTLNDTRTFVLTYRVAGVVRQEDGADALYWQALPDDYDYPIAASRTTVRYPAGLELTGAPTVQVGNAAVSQDGNTVSFTSSNLSADSPLVIGLRFPAGSLISAAPSWQARQQAQAAQAPWWIGIAAVIFVAGTIAVVSQVQRYRPQVRTTPHHVAEPPGKLPPGIAGTLQNADAKPTWSNALGTLFDLAEQGVVEIDESPDKKWYRKHDFLVRLLERPSHLHTHQHALLELLFESKNGPVKTVKFSDLSQMVTSRRWKEFVEATHAEIKASNYLDPERQQARKALTVTGFLLLMSGLAALVLTAIFMDISGLGALAVGFSLMGLGIVAFIGGASLTSLTDEAYQTVNEWKQYSQYLRQVSRSRKAVTGPQMFVKYLPYAATFGILHQWSRHFEKTGWTEVPPYFNALPGSDPSHHMAAFVAMSASSSSSGTAGAAGAGAAGAGAAGGGAAGAG